MLTKDRNSRADLSLKTNLERNYDVPLLSHTRSHWICAARCDLRLFKSLERRIPALSHRLENPHEVRLALPSASPTRESLEINRHVQRVRPTVRRFGFKKNV